MQKTIQIHLHLQPADWYTFQLESWYIIKLVDTGMGAVSGYPIISRKRLPQLSGFMNLTIPDFRSIVIFPMRLIRNNISLKKGLVSSPRVFVGLAILIACLGLFGLAACTAQRRQNEIGVRKVLVATVTNVMIKLSKDFLGSF